MNVNLDWMSLLGAVLLVGATIPQAVKLFRTRDASSFSAPFVAMNTAGLGLLLARSIQIGEVGFAVTNAVTFSFWGALMAFKARDMVKGRGQTDLVTLRPASGGGIDTPVAPRQP